MMSVEIKEIELWIKTTVPGLMKNHSVPGAAVAVLVNGEVVFTGGRGVQCSDEKTPINCYKRER